MTRITLNSASGEFLYIHKTENAVTISNRDFFSNVSDLTPISSCYTMADYFISAPDSKSFKNSNNLFNLTSVREVAVSSKKIRFCY